MGDKVILTEVLEASHLTDTYSGLTPKSILHELRSVRDDIESVHYSSTSDRATLGEPEDQYSNSPTEDDNREYTVDEAVEHLGFGKFQMKLSLLTGMAWMADAMEMMLLSLLSPALACEWGISAFEQALVTTCVFTGMMTSSTFWGKICDRFGRKTGLVSSTLIAFVMGSLSSMSPHYYVLLALRGLTGFGIGGVPQSVTLYAEFLPTSHRARCVVLIESFWAIGAVFESLLAYLVMNTFGWRALILFSSLPLALFSALSYWLPESARFHMASGHPEKALETLQKAARENGVQLPKGKLVNLTNFKGDKDRGGFTTLLNSQFRKTTLLLWLIWALNAFSYYGMVLFTTVLFQSHDPCHGGLFSNSTTIAVCQPLTRSDYFDLLSTTVAEFPGLIITMFVIEWLGRKKTMALEFGIFSIFTFILYFCLDRFTVTMFIFVARAFISGAFQCAYVYTPEVYPTTLRAIGLGASSAMARIGAITTPFVAQVLSQQSLSYPIGIYGTAALVGLVAALALPIETKGRQMTCQIDWIAYFVGNKCLYIRLACEYVYPLFLEYPSLPLIYQLPLEWSYFASNIACILLIVNRFSTALTPLKSKKFWKTNEVPVFCGWFALSLLETIPDLFLRASFNQSGFSLQFTIEYDKLMNEVIIGCIVLLACIVLIIATIYIKFVNPEIAKFANDRNMMYAGLTIAVTTSLAASSSIAYHSNENTTTSFIVEHCIEIHQMLVVGILIVWDPELRKYLKKRITSLLNKNSNTVVNFISVENSLP